MKEEWRLPVLAGKHSRALDSSLPDDAVTMRDKVTRLVAVVPRAIREVPGGGVSGRRAQRS